MPGVLLNELVLINGSLQTNLHYNHHLSLSIQLSFLRSCPSSFIPFFRLQVAYALVRWGHASLP